MTDKEIEVFNRDNPVEFDNGLMKHGYHRGYAMIGRLIKGKPYIPLYMETEKIYNVAWKNDNKIRIKNPLYNLKSLSQLNDLDRREYCLTQSSILALMGIRENDDIDIIISSKLRNELEPRFYFSRKHRKDEKNTKDWEGIENFYKMESYKGYPFSDCSLDKWGFEFI